MSNSLLWEPSSDLNQRSDFARYLAWIVIAAMTVLFAACDRDPGVATSSGATPVLEYRDDEFPELSLEPIITFCADPQDCFFRDITVGAAGAHGTTFLGGPGTQVVQFDSAGRRVRTFGREGSGPGEYQIIMTLDVNDAGELQFLDVVGFRQIIFDTAGAHRSTTPLKIPRGVPSNIRLRNGRIIALLIPGGRAVGDTVVARFAEITSSEVRNLEVTVRTGARSVTGSLGAAPYSFFEAAPVWDVDEELGFVYSSSAAYRIERFLSTGSPAYEIRMDVAPEPVRPADLDAEMKRRLGRRPVPPEIRTMIEAEAKSAAKHHPVLRDLRVFGRLIWVSRNTTGDSARWDVFTIAGKPWGTFHLPTNAKLLRADSTKLLVATETEIGIPVAIWYHIRR